FTRQHDPRDTFEGITPAYLAQNARVNAAAAASLALAPPAPAVNNQRGQPQIARRPSGYDANLRWTPSPGASAYRVFWRDAWGPDWQHDLLVGASACAPRPGAPANALPCNLVLPNMQIDDFVFGVAAVDALGHESLVTPYIAPPRAVTQP